MVTLKGVSKWYDGHHKVLDQVDLQIEKGEFLYLVGGSGAGKSSLLRLLTTEERPSSGTISLFGYDLSQISSHTLKVMRRSIGTIPQGVKLIPDLTVSENIFLSLKLCGRMRNSANAGRQIDELLEKLGLIEKRNALASELSGGEAQRVAVARALIRQPELIVADEPTGAQDREHTWALMDLFVKTHSRGCAVVLATHDREIVRRVRKKCAVLKGGHISLPEGLCFY